MCRKANGKPQKVTPFNKMTKNLPDLSSSLNITPTFVGKEFTLKRKDLLPLASCLHTNFLLKGVYSERKEFDPMGSKFLLE